MTPLELEILHPHSRWGIESKVVISDHSLLLKGNDVVIQLFSVGNHDGILTVYRYVCGQALLPSRFATPFALDARRASV